MAKLFPKKPFFMLEEYPFHDSAINLSKIYKMRDPTIADIMDETFDKEMI